MGTTNNGFDIVSGLTQDILTELVQSAFDDAVASGTLQPITIPPYTFEIRRVDLQICPSPDPDTGWPSCLDARVSATSGSSSPEESSLSLKINTDQIGFGVVSQPSFTRSGGKAGSYVDCGNLEKPIPDTGCTLMAWVEGQTAETQTIISLADPKGGSDLELLLTDSALELKYLGATYAIAEPTVVPDLTEGLHHLAAVISPSEIAFYVDGQPQGAPVPLPSFAGFGTAHSLLVAGSVTGISDGLVTGVSIWASALTSRQVQQYMNANLTTPGLELELRCIGYWLFDPENAINLLSPEETAVETVGEAELVELVDQTTQTYVYFNTDRSEDIFKVTAGALGPQIERKLAEKVAAGALVGPTRDRMSQMAVPTFAYIITETEGSAWRGPNQLMLLVMMDNNIPPSQTESSYKEAFADEALLHVPADCNVTAAARDYFLFSQAQANLENKFRTSVAVGPPAELTGVNTKSKKRLHAGDLKFKTRIKNGKGIFVHAGIDGREVIDGDVSTVVTVTVVTDAAGARSLKVGLTGTSLDLGWNQDNPGVAAVETFLAVLLLTPCNWCALCVYTLAAVVLSIIEDRLRSMINDQGFSTPIENLDLKALEFSDGIVASAVLYPPGPLITGISAKEGKVGDTVTILGKGFVDANGESRLKQASVGGQLVPISPPTGEYEKGRTTAKVPLGGTGTPTPIKVQGTSKYWSNPSDDPFVVLGAAAPGGVHLEDDSGLAGETIKVSGSGFSGTTDVEFGSRPAPTFTVKSDGKLEVQVPRLLTDEVHLTVTNNIGSGISDNLFRPTPDPVVSSFEYEGGGAYACKGQTLKIRGENFGQAGSENTKVEFCAGSATDAKTQPVPATVIDETELHVTVPGSATKGPVWVKTGASESLPSQRDCDIRSTTPPSGITFSPAMGKGLDKIVVSGAGFTGTKKVQIGGQNCGFELQSDGKLEVTVNKQAETGTITVTNRLESGDEGSGESTDEFVMVKSPRLDKFEPTSGSAGDNVMLRGAGFMTEDGAASTLKSVTFGSTTAEQAAVVEPDTIKVIVPPEVPARDVLIKVQTYGGFATSKERFTVTKA